MMAYFLFNIETRNICIVGNTQKFPMPLEEIPFNLRELPTGLDVVSSDYHVLLIVLLFVSAVSAFYYV